MTCDVPPRECLHDHIRPHLDAPRPNATGTTIRALCPVHDETHPSLAVSTGESTRIVWQCFAGCDRADIRVAMITAGIPPGCLPRVRRDNLDKHIIDILATPGRHAFKLLRITAAIEGYTELPRGAELERIAGLAGIGRAMAYRLRSRGEDAAGVNPDNCSYHSAKTKPRNRRSLRRVAGVADVYPIDKSLLSRRRSDRGKSTGETLRGDDTIGTWGYATGTDG